MNVLYWVAVALVTIVSASRLTRLATVDKFPPVVWLRERYEDKTDGTGWQRLTLCGYCFSFWSTAVVVGWGYLADVYEVSRNHDTAWLVWWLLFGTLAASYLAAILMANDGDNEDDD